MQPSLMLQLLAEMSLNEARAGGFDMSGAPQSATNNESLTLKLLAETQLNEVRASGFDMSGAPKAQATARQLVETFPRWHHSFEIAPGVMTPGAYEPSFLWNKLRLTGNQISGRRALDIGACDGYFSLELAKAGASVTAVDYREKTNTGFAIMEKLNKQPIPFIRSNLYELTPESLGLFDLILFLGVLYHTPDIFRALHVVRQLCKPSARVFIESEYLADAGPEASHAAYCIGNSLNDDYSNFWVPSTKCLLDLLHDTSYEVLRFETWGTRILVEAKAAQILESGHKTNLAYGYRS